MAVTTFEIYLLLEDNKMSYKFLIVLPYEIHVKVETIFKTGGIPLYCSCCNFVLVQNLNDCTKERYLLCKKIFAHFWNRYNDSLTQVLIFWASLVKINTKILKINKYEVNKYRPSSLLKSFGYFIVQQVPSLVAGTSFTSRHCL
uniref:Uncharacterized protein n=1 Tax=Cacopsylla melanoneura TaxID=428564 RepID=A0A8D8V6C4_9HEMI